MGDQTPSSGACSIANLSDARNSLKLPIMRLTIRDGRRGSGPRTGVREFAGHIYEMPTTGSRGLAMAGP